MKTANLAQVQAPELSKVVKADAVELHYQPDSDVVVHKAGCQHRQAFTVGYHVSAFNVADAAKYVDDWYYVAPCAKKAS